MIIKDTHRRKIDIIVDLLRNLGLIGIGNMLIAIAVNGIVIPHEFLERRCHRHGAPDSLPAFRFCRWQASIWCSTYLFSLLVGPLWVAGSLFTVLSACLSLTATLEWVHLRVALDDKILAALFAGILTGIGGGLTLRSHGSAGGLDILSVILLKRFSISLGKTFLSINALILVVTTFLFSLETALYSFIYIYITTRMMELVITGISKRKAVLIISDQWAKISEEILYRLERGVTQLHGQGGYSGKEQRILYAVVSMRELHRIKRIVQIIDARAFLVVQDTLEVMGYRIGNQPHW